MSTKKLLVYKPFQPRYIGGGSIDVAVPQAARTTSVLSTQTIALAFNYAGRLFNPQGTGLYVPGFDEEGGAHAHAA